MKRPMYRRPCMHCGEKLTRYELLYNINECDECIAANLAQSNRDRIARKTGRDPAQLDDNDLPDFDPETHR